MKKIIIVTVLLCMVTAAGAYYFYYRSFSEKYTAEQLLPAETLATVRFEHFKQSIDKFRSGRLGQAVSQIDLNSVLTELGTPPASIKEAENFIAGVKETLDSTWFDALFGQQVTLAVLPADFTDAAKITEEEIARALAIVLRPRHPAKLLDWLKQMFTADIQVASETYHQWEINRFEWQPGVDVHYTVTNGLVVLALNREPVVRCLDTLQRPETSLMQNADFQTVERELQGQPEAEAFGFINIDELYRMGTVLLSKKMAGRPDAGFIEKQLTQLNGFIAGGYAAYDDGSTVLQKKIVVLVDRDALEPQFARMLNVKPEIGGMLAMLPENTLGFTWQNTLDLRLYYDSLTQSEDFKPEDIEAVNANLQQKFGVSLDELVDAFGPQWGMALSSVKTGGMFPIPELGLFIQSARPEVAEKIILQAVGKSDMPVLIDEYKSQRIKYLQLPFGSDLSPCYAYINGYCILAVNTNMIKSYIDTMNNGRNITGSDAFKAIDKGLSDKNNQLAFVKFDQLIDTVPEIMRWGSSMAAYANPDKARQFTPVAEQVINPLVDGLKMYKTVGFRSFIAEAKIESRIYTEVDKMGTN
ncbi:MAG: DUF3352 domain-containing protein [Desulfobacterales bacterium]|nr:MAG: DUF3352 domain-containing protein [Desulfobacterales bacterium]